MERECSIQLFFFLKKKKSGLNTDVVVRRIYCWVKKEEKNCSYYYECVFHAI